MEFSLFLVATLLYPTLLKKIMAYIEEGKYQKVPSPNLTYATKRFTLDSQGIFIGKVFQSWNTFFNPDIKGLAQQGPLTNLDYQKICSFYAKHFGSETYLLYIDTYENQFRPHLIKGTQAQTLIKRTMQHVDNLNKKGEGSCLDIELKKHFEERKMILFSYNPGSTNLRGQRDRTKAKSKRKQKKALAKGGKA